MAEFDVAHLHVQGQDLIIIPLDRQFDYKAAAEQADVHESLRMCARAAGLQGTVAIVWQDRNGRMAFRAPQSWHPFFLGINLAVVADNVYRTLTCAD